MKNSTKTLALLLALVLALSCLTACNGKKDEPVIDGDNPDAIESTLPESVEEDGDDEAAAPAEAAGLIADLTDELSGMLSDAESDHTTEDVAIPGTDFVGYATAYVWDEEPWGFVAFLNEGSTKYSSYQLEGESLVYFGLFDLGQGACSAIYSVRTGAGDVKTVIATFPGGDFAKYWTENGGVFQGGYEPMDGAFEGYADGVLTIGGASYTLGENLTLIPA